MVELTKALSESARSLSASFIAQSSKKVLAKQAKLIENGDLAGALAVAEAWCADLEKNLSSIEQSVRQRMAEQSRDWVSNLYYKLFNGGVSPTDAALPSLLAIEKLVDNEHKAARERVGELKYRLRIESTLKESAP